MNRTIVRRIVVGIVLLASAFIAFLAGSARWEDMSTNEKPLRQAYAVWQDGTTSYGAYCSKDGTKLEGGGICYIDEFSRPHTRDEIVRGSIGVSLFWLVLIGGGGALAVSALLSTPTSRRPAPINA